MATREASHRSDAQRNRRRVLEAARAVFSGSAGNAATTVTAAPPEETVARGQTAEQSMAEVARRAGVSRATLYRNFPTRRELLESLFVDEVEAMTVISPTDGRANQVEDAGAALRAWLQRFAAFEDSKRVIVHELLEYTSPGDPVFGSSRQRVLDAGGQLLADAQRAGAVRNDTSIEQAVDLVLAVVRLDRTPEQIEAILRVALDGLRPLT